MLSQRFFTNILRAASLCLTMGAAAHAHAFTTTHFVATTGSDATGDGTMGNPWATITHAVNSVPDDALILVAPGTYGRAELNGRFETGVTVRSSTPYQARLRHDATVVRCFYGKGITLEGFDIAHDGPGAGALLMQVQDATGDADPVEDITIRNNVFHDSYNNDLLKINNNARDVRVLGNLFYNQAGSDEHIDINSVADVLVEGNVFFNDFAGSGRADTGTSSYIVIKDSNANTDGRLGSENITVRRNVFLHWEGSTGQGFVRVGEDGTSNFEAIGVLIENNLMLGNGTMKIRSPLQFQGVKNVTARANTIVGNMPSLEFGFRIVTVGASPASDGVHLHNNIWSDPTGTMSDTFNRGGATVNLTFDNNLYFNDGNAFPTSSESIVEVSDDASAIVGDPLLPDNTGAPLPRWNEGSGTFGDGSTTIAAVFENLVLDYGVPATGSAAIGAADPAHMPADDILGNPRSEGGAPDVGAFEKPSCVGAGEGEPCNDGDDCTANDVCTGGECAGSAAAANGTPCDDGVGCTANDVCTGGACAGSAAAADGTPCDDGIDCTAGDACSAGACIGSEGAADAQACDDDDPCSTTDVCAAGTCAGTLEPRSDCVEAGRGAIDLRSDRLTWKWKGAGVGLADLGDPTTTTSYRLCVYDGVAGAYGVAITTSAPAGGTCGTKPCWRAKSDRGFQFSSRSGTADGLTKLKLGTNGTDGSMKLTARGSGLPAPVLPVSQDPDVVAQLVSSDAGCWETTLAPPASIDAPTRFKDSR